LTNRTMAKWWRGVVMFALLAAIVTLAWRFGAPASGRAGKTSIPSKTAVPSTSSGPLVPHAVPVVRCDQAACSACPEKTRPESVEGECCPRCVALDQSACDFGQARYGVLRREAEIELRSCKLDQDCIVASFGDACRASCPTPLNREKLGPVAASLSEQAEGLCQHCAPAAYQCEYQASMVAHCVNNRCEVLPPVVAADGR
jgi:hypothetical protein